MNQRINSLTPGLDFSNAGLFIRYRDTFRDLSSVRARNTIAPLVVTESRHIDPEFIMRAYRIVVTLDRSYLENNHYLGSHAAVIWFISYRSGIIQQIPDLEIS